MKASKSNSLSVAVMDGTGQLQVEVVDEVRRMACCLSCYMSCYLLLWWKVGGVCR
jgi:hypothetical protein